MPFEVPELPANKYEAMDFAQLAADPEAGPILQKFSLEYLQTIDYKFSKRGFRKNLDESGYLVNESGQSVMKPSQGITEGAAMDWVVKKTKQELSGEKVADDTSGILEGEEDEGEKLTQAIAEAKDLPAIFEILEKVGGIQGSRRFYSYSEIKDTINKIQNDGKDITFLTNSNGLRTKVAYILGYRLKF